MIDVHDGEEVEALHPGQHVVRSRSLKRERVSEGQRHVDVVLGVGHVVHGHPAVGGAVFFGQRPGIQRGCRIVGANAPEEEAEEKRKFEESMRGAEVDYYFNLGKQKREEQENANKPKCPTCGSTNIKKMGGIERGASIAAFGLFSKKINKTFKCSNCGYTW